MRIDLNTGAAVSGSQTEKTVVVSSCAVECSANLSIPVVRTSEAATLILKAVIKNPHPPMLTLNGPSTNLTAPREPEPMTNSPFDASFDASRALVEQIACAIADAQSALFAGRFQDLERCVTHQQELCIALTTIHQAPSRASGNTHGKLQLVAAAQRTHQQNRVFDAIGSVRRFFFGFLQ
jgi:hypothetical protein